LDDTTPHPTPERDLRDALRRSDQETQIWVERRRYGKEVTIIGGIADADLERVGKDLKRRLAVGGTVKDGRIELQGDQRARARASLTELGFANAPDASSNP
jgi:translation initiation factor 1